MKRNSSVLLWIMGLTLLTSINVSGNSTPTPVFLDTPTGITSNSIMLSWSQSTDPDFANYTIFQSTEEDLLGKAVAEIGSSVRTWYNETSLSPDTTYYFTVRTCDFFNMCSDSNQVNGTTLSGWSSPNISIEFNEIPSCVLPIDVNLQHRFTVKNIGSEYEVFDLEIYCPDTDQVLACNPQPPRFYLYPGENQGGEITIGQLWGRLADLEVGEWDRTLEFRFQDPSTYPSTDLFAVTKKYPITVLDQNNITGGFTVEGRVLYPEGNPCSGCNVELVNVGHSTQIITPDNGSFSFAVPYNKKWTLFASGYGMDGKPVWNLTPGGYYEVYLSEYVGPEYELTKNVTTDIGFWRGSTSSDGQHIMLLQGMENWEDPLMKNQSKIMLYTIDGEKEWEYPMGWEAWGGDLSRDAEYAVYVTVDHEEVSDLVLLNATDGSLIWNKTVTSYNFPDDHGVMSSLEVRLSSTSNFVGFGTQGGDFYLLNIETGDVIWHNWTVGQIRFILFNDDDSAVYIGSGDGYLYKFAVDDGTLLWRSWIESWPFVEGLKLSPDESLIASVGKSGEITMINTDDGSSVLSHHGGGTAGYCAFSPNGGYLAVGVGSSFSYLFNTDGDMISRWTPAAYAGQFTSDSQYLIAPLQELSIFSLDGVEISRSEVGSPSQSQFFYITPDDEKIVFATRDMPASGGVSIEFFRKKDSSCSLTGDYPPCGEVTLSEVVDFIGLWAQGQAVLEDVVDLINAWAS